MVVTRWTSMIVVSIVVMCMNHSVLGAVTKSAAPNFDAELEHQPYAEVPVESIQQFVQIYGVVKDNYVVEKSDEALFQQAIKGLVSGLDRYSRYLSAEEYKQLLQYTEGDLASVDFDLTFDTRSQQWMIKGLRVDADSAKLGLQDGMTVFKIDDQELKKLNLEQVKHLLIGAIGSTLSLQLSQNSTPLNIVRNKKIETDIQAQLLPNQVLVIQVKVFQQDTANEIKRLLEEYASTKYKAVLIDLRNNPGGLLSSAVETADLFLSQGIIVSTKSRTEGDQQYQALPNLEFQKIKLGILINKRSASAAEVFTAALKDHGRAWVVGEKSYGKGVVQKLFPLEDGAALQMTVSHYYTPKGLMIEGIGIQPNYTYIQQQDIKEETYLDHAAELLLTH